MTTHKRPTKRVSDETENVTSEANSKSVDRKKRYLREREGKGQERREEGAAVRRKI